MCLQPASTPNTLPWQGTGACMAASMVSTAWSPAPRTPGAQLDRRLRARRTGAPSIPPDAALVCVPLKHRPRRSGGD